MRCSCARSSFSCSAATGTRPLRSVGMHGVRASYAHARSGSRTAPPGTDHRKEGFEHCARRPPSHAGVSGWLGLARLSIAGVCEGEGAKTGKAQTFLARSASDESPEWSSVGSMCAPSRCACNATRRNELHAKLRCRHAIKSSEAPSGSQLDSIMWQRCARCRCGSVVPGADVAGASPVSPGADVAGASPVSPGADVAAVCLPKEELLLLEIRLPGAHPNRLARFVPCRSECVSTVSSAQIARSEVSSAARVVPTTVCAPCTGRHGIRGSPPQGRMP